MAVVHNGVIENYAALKRQLEADGVVFQSDTDTEVIAQLIARHLDGCDLVEAVGRTLPLLKGTYGLAVVSPRFPGQIVGARLGSPLVLGIGDGENFLASDSGALIGKTERVVYLQDAPDVRADAARSGTSSTPTGRGSMPHVHADRLDRRGGRQGRLRALHAQGDLRAARGAGERHARPAQRRRRQRPLRRPEPEHAASSAGPNASS